MKIRKIPVLNDNFSYLLIDGDTNTAAVIDPAEAEPVLAAVDEEGVELTHILCTHHHWDHTAGNEGILEDCPQLTVVGGSVDADQIHGCNKTVDDGDTVSIGELEGDVYFTPCHTKGHIAYHFGNALFCGDTLFVGGCGRFFEGDGKDMHHALMEVFAKLPGDTQVFCGHEYTVSNLEFAITVEPDNKALQEKLAWARKQRDRSEWAVPSTIAGELSYNPFMRVDQPSIQQAMGTPGDPVATMAKLRQTKNQS